MMSDMCYISVASYDGYQHFHLIQDETTHYVWGFLLKANGEDTNVVVLMWHGLSHKAIASKCLVLTKEGGLLTNNLGSSFARTEWNF